MAPTPPPRPAAPAPGATAPGATAPAAAPIATSTAPVDAAATATASTAPTPTASTMATTATSAAAPGARRDCSTFLCCSAQRIETPIPVNEKGKQRAAPTPTPSPSGVRCTSSPTSPRTSPSPPSPELPPPRKSPSPVASLKMKLGLDESWMAGPATGGRWWMEPASKPYFPGKMKRREKKRMAGMNEGLRPATGKSSISVASGVSGTTVGSTGPRREVPGSVKRYLKNPEDIGRAKGPAIVGAGTGVENAKAMRPQMRRGEGYTKKWARGVKATDLPPIAPRIDSPPASPVGGDSAGRGNETGLKVIREESSTPARLAEEKSRLLLERGRCLLQLRAIQKTIEANETSAMDVEVLRKAEATKKELEIVEEKLRIVAEKTRGLHSAGGSA